jgi:DNA repair protein RadA/Sms
MAKKSSLYLCSACAYQTVKWLGCCPQCATWESFVEKTTSTSGSVGRSSASVLLGMQPLKAVALHTEERFTTGISEWDRVMGGGIQRGAFMILTGDPGIGKSTLLLKIAHELSRGYRVFYFSSEESCAQVRQRAERINCMDNNVAISDRANLDEIIAIAETERPDIVVLDSIQNCHSSDLSLLPGSVGQLRESAFKLMRLAKDHQIAVLMTGHITKDGAMAGPKTLEHMVDAVFYLQGEDRWQTRILRSVKNRFGPVHELGFFEMHETGMNEMTNINAHLLSHAQNSPGSVLTSTLEGSRPLLLELQSLVVPTKYGTPQRVISGLDHTQVALITAILEKYLNVKLGSHDIFCKVSGGLKIKGSGSDLATALALLSSYFQKPVPYKSLALGEIALTGHVRPINAFGLYAGEARKFGIPSIYVARGQKHDLPRDMVCEIGHVSELIDAFR